MRLRALLLIAIVVGRLTAVRSEEKPDETQAIAKIHNLGGWVAWRDERTGGEVRSVPLSPPPQSPRRVRTTETPVAPISVTLLGSQNVSDDDLRCLEAFPNLSELSVESTAISDAGLVHIAKLKHLRTLRLSRTRITDAGLKTIGGLHELRDLYLLQTAISDVGLAEVGKLENLRVLWLGSTRITDAGVTRIDKLANLALLNLSETTVTDASARTLKRFPRLRGLWLSATAISDIGLKEIGDLHNLTVLDLGGTHVTDSGLQKLAGLKKLERLVVAQTKVTANGVKQLQRSLPRTQILRDEEREQERERERQQEQSIQHADPKFDVSISHPAYADKHPTVLFDEAHNNFHTASGRYKVFADLITNDGYRVTPNRKPFTSELLAKYDLLVTANAPAKAGDSKSAFTPAECDSVEKWVRGGGALLIITDHEPFGSGSEELGKRFGVNMSLRVTIDPDNQTGNGLSFSREKHLLGEHAILRGRNAGERVNRVLTFTGQSLKGPPESSALLKFADTAKDVERGRQSISAAGSAQGIAFKFGRGRVVVMGEAGELSAQVYGANPPKKMGMNVPDCDNRQFALNIVHWLSGLID
jgi:Leucine Rich repeat